jgi:hypothetical protein
MPYKLLDTFTFWHFLVCMGFAVYTYIKTGSAWKTSGLLLGGGIWWEWFENTHLTEFVYEPWYNWVTDVVADGLGIWTGIILARRIHHHP